MLRQVAGAVAQEAVLGAPLFPIVVIGGIEKQQAEGAVGDGGGEEVGGQGVVQPGGGLRGPLLVQLHPIGLQGQRAGGVQVRGQLRQGGPGPAAGIEQADGAVIPGGEAGRGAQQGGQ